MKKTIRIQDVLYRLVEISTPGTMLQRGHIQRAAQASRLGIRRVISARSLSESQEFVFYDMGRGDPVPAKSVG